MAKMYLNRAMAKGVMLEMESDENVIVMGEDIISSGGGMSNLIGVPEKFPDRCFDMPISEAGFCQMAVGAAMLGMKPIVDLMFADFTAVCADALINSAPKMHMMSFGQADISLVIVAANGGIGTYGQPGTGPSHSQCVEGWYNNVPGLKIAAPYYPEDALGLMRASIRDKDPVLFLYHEGSLGLKGEVNSEEPIPLNGAGRVVREGTDVTVVAVQSMVPVALAAAEELAEEGVSVEVVDPRVLVPFDKETMKASVRKTGRLVITHEAPVRGGIGGEIAAVAAEECFADLKAPVRRCAGKNAPIAPGNLEYYLVPHAEDIRAAVMETLEGSVKM